MSSHYSSIPIIDRMSSVLERVIASPNGVTASGLLQTEGIPKTTLYRLLTSMTQNEFLTYQADTGNYFLGGKFTATYLSMDERVSRLRGAAEPHLRMLADQVQETVKLSVLSGLQSYTISSVEGSKPIRISIDTGAIFPLHAGAAGKVLMCSLGEGAIRQYYELYGIRYTDATIMTVEDMKAELQSIRACGYAIDRGEYMSEIRAVAVPVMDSARQIIAAISIAYPASNQDRIDVPQLAELVAQTAQAISVSAGVKKMWDRPARLIGGN